MALPLILLLSRDENLLNLLKARLADRFDFLLCETLEAARLTLRSQKFWSLIADFRISAQGGHPEDRFLEEINAGHPKMDVVVLTSGECPEPLERRLACSGMRHFRTPAEVQLLPDYFAEKSPRPAEVAAPAHKASLNEGEVEADYALTGLTRRFETNTPKLKMMLADLEVAAKHDVTVLLIGETGSGKTFLSKLIHEISPRRTEPFLPVACGALPSELIESELFGHVKGAFTSAHADKEGKFVAAKRGTILLDEIDVLGLEQQVKLLRAIESGEFEPVGSNRTLKSEARLIVASNLDLQPLVEQGKFRPDLYYRLNMLKFEIPPLRARKPDIVPLARKFIKEQSLKHNMRVDHIDESLFTALLRYPWPGNVRELEHVIQRAVIYSRDNTVSAQNLPTHVVMCQAGPGNEGTYLTEQMHENSPSQTSLGQQVAFSEREIIEQALFKNNFSRTGTAKSLGISRVTLYNKMKKYGMTK